MSELQAQWVLFCSERHQNPMKVKMPVWASEEGQAFHLLGL